MSTAAKQRAELELVRRLLAVLGHSNAKLESGDRPDVSVEIDGVRTGIEVTLFHADERADTRGSSLRAREEAARRETQRQDVPVWGVLNPVPALITRIERKIDTADAYDIRRYGQIWLLVSASLPEPGAIASTFMAAPFFNVDELNRRLHASLSRSRFSVVYVHLLLGRRLFHWCREDAWQAIEVNDGR